MEAESAVKSVDASTEARLVSIRGWRGYNNPWMLEDESDVDFSYVNLIMNPERYTGYKASSSSRLADCLVLVEAPLAHVITCLRRCMIYCEIAPRHYRVFVQCMT